MSQLILLRALLNWTPSEIATLRFSVGFAAHHTVFPVKMFTENMLSRTGSSDEGLLQAFAGSGSQDAFRALVRKYLGMVSGIAIRRTGDRALAEEISQNVFTILARKARGLKCGTTLGAWIHRVTLIETADALRRKLAHQTRMNVVSQHLMSELDGRDVWRDAMPLLDEGIDALNAAEREVVLLRFFEGKSFREIGRALGKTDDAAQKQVERALHKLSAFLKGKGVTVPAAVLGSGLATQLAQAAPSVLAHGIARGALGSASSLNAKILILKALEAMTNTKLKSAFLATAALAVPIVMQWEENSRLREALERAHLQRVISETTGYARYGNGIIGQPAQESASSISDSGLALAAASGLQFSSGGIAEARDPVHVAREWEEVLFIADPLHRSQRLAGLLAALTAADAAGIAEAFARAKSAGIQFPDEQRLFLRAWGKLDGFAAMDCAINHCGEASGEAVAALGGWATIAPRDARAWLEALPESQGKEALVYGLLDGWSTSDFHAAAAYAESRPASQAQESFRELLLQRALRSGGIAAAQTWVHRIAENGQNGDYKQRAFSGVVEAMLYRDPAAAARWISGMDGQVFVGADAVTKTAAKLAETSPTDALQWMGTLQEADVHGVQRGAGMLLQNWAQHDARAAGAWLQSNTNYPFYDQLTSCYVRAVAAADPNAAKQWANTIRETSLREQTVASLNEQPARLQGSFIQYGLASTGTSGTAVHWLVDDLTPTAMLSVTRESGDSVELSSSSDSRPITEHMPTRTMKAHPHGPGSQWNNCASCHPR